MNPLRRIVTWAATWSGLPHERQAELVADVEASAQRPGSCAIAEAGALVALVLERRSRSATLGRVEAAVRQGAWLAGLIAAVLVATLAIVDLVTTPTPSVIRPAGGLLAAVGLVGLAAGKPFPRPRRIAMAVGGLVPLALVTGLAADTDAALILLSTVVALVLLVGGWFDLRLASAGTILLVTRFTALDQGDLRSLVLTGDSSEAVTVAIRILAMTALLLGGLAVAVRSARLHPRT